MSTSSETESVPVPPDSVRVWRGFRLANLEQGAFFRKLGSFFIPGTVQIQSAVGLTAYLPSVLPKDKPAEAPDEIALVFYRYQEAYDEAKETVGGRAYSDLHGVAFDLQKSLSGFPELFSGVVEPNGRYHLFQEHVDWQHGYVNVFVGVRSNVQDLLGCFTKWLVDVQSRDGRRPDGAVASGTADYVVYWEHWPDESAAADSLIPRLAEIVEPVYQQPISPTPLSEGLWDRYSGVTVEGGESFNFQFQRQCQSWQGS